MWIISISVGSNYKYPSVRSEATTLIITETTKVPMQHGVWTTAPQTRLEAGWDQSVVSEACILESCIC